MSDFVPVGALTRASDLSSGHGRPTLVHCRARAQLIPAPSARHVATEK
jgi:hypothetical protein